MPQVIPFANVKARGIRRDAGASVNTFRLVKSDSSEKARIDIQLSTDGEPVPVEKVVLKGVSTQQFRIKYKATEDSETYENYMDGDSDKIKVKYF